MQPANDHPTGIIEKIKSEKERFIKGWNVPDEQKPYRNMFVIVWFLTIIFVLVDTYYDQKKRPQAKPLVPITFTPPPEMPIEPSVNEAETMPLNEGPISHE